MSSTEGRELKICPRCKEAQDVELFVYPVRLCMVCYSRQSGNIGLSLAELVHKAKTSKWSNAHAKERIEEIEEQTVRIYQGLKGGLALPSVQPKPPGVRVQDILARAGGTLEDASKGLEEPRGDWDIPCEGCNRFYSVDGLSLQQVDGKPMSLCLGCLSDKEDV